jgi:hypothetical protein
MFKELGRERVPSFLGGALDYEAAKQQWYAKMDAAMAERHQHPRGHQVRCGCRRVGVPVGAPRPLPYLACTLITA